MRNTDGGATVSGQKQPCCCLCLSQNNSFLFLKQNGICFFRKILASELNVIIKKKTCSVLRARGLLECPCTCPGWNGRPATSHTCNESSKACIFCLGCSNRLLTGWLSIIRSAHSCLPVTRLCVIHPTPHWCGEAGAVMSTARYIPQTMLGLLPNIYYSFDLQGEGYEVILHLFKGENRRPLFPLLRISFWTVEYFHKEDWPFTGQLALCFGGNIGFFIVLSVSFIDNARIFYSQIAFLIDSQPWSLSKCHKSVFWIGTWWLNSTESDTSNYSRQLDCIYNKAHHWIILSW